ncbi:hypothetical protein BDV93DRAFT_524242 [Ceratobasidium sp. AG-I]|nr:hypothetical protein BDV93DRAFT_524242 [Ceratobasidium sp. AG-I]
MASSDHEMVDLTGSPDAFATPHKDSPRPIVIGSSLSTSRDSSPPDAHSTPTKDHILKLDEFLARHRADDDDGVDGDTTDHVTADPPTSASVTPQTTTPVSAPAATTGTTKAAKVKQPKRRASRSPSPLPAPPPPMLTVRLEWDLPRPGTAEHNERYAVNVRDMARSTGQRHATPVPPARIPMDSEDEGTKGDTSAVEGGGKEVKRRRRKRKEEFSEYDLSDAFIDDSDLQRDSRTHFAQTKQQGFYVSSGEVALVKDKLAPKPRKRAPAAPAKPLSKVATTKAAQRIASTSQAHNNGNTSTSNLSVSTLAAALPQPMLTSGAPVYARTPSPPISPAQGQSSAPAPNANRTAPSLPPIATPSCDPSFKSDLVQMSSFITEATDPSGDGTRTSPIALDDEGWSMNQSTRLGVGLVSPGGMDMNSPGGGSAGGGVKRQRTETNGAGGSGTVTPSGGGAKKRKGGSDTEPFSTELEGLFRGLQDDIKAHSWENKAKFPPNLKPRLVQVATEALRLGEYNENFFNYLPKIFPYNRFTMMKLTKRLMYATHNEKLRRRGEELMTELKEQIDQGLQVQESLHAAALDTWETKKAGALAKWQEEVQQAQTSGVPQDQLPPKPEIPMPQKRYRWNDVIKDNVWQQVCLFNEIAALANEAHGFDPNLAQKVSEQSLRKSLYQKIVVAFPEGWLTTNLISREVSEMKRKEKKVADAGEAEDEEEPHA